MTERMTPYRADMGSFYAVIGTLQAIIALHFPLDTGNRAFFQPTHLRLRNTDFSRDFHLGFSLAKPQRQNIALPFIQMRNRIFETDLLQPMLVTVAFIPHLIHHTYRIACVGVNRLI